ncbi:glycosyl transferase [Sulfuricaulis limicola]|uniref:Glycosyl transferase n=1 Tax=Sulfuricaulis limicola TaxID=1620215 RepID=A0A1B4XEL1_9GAMM|nr:glycosyltransferase family 2 protein [Sulfuricaulis limicola]BAV33223.1 glycosyl transferase [Sulfuricaulis limicola]
MQNKLSIIIPAKNEEAGLAKILPKLRTLFTDAEIIVVDDGSTDGTADLCRSQQVTVVSHPYSKGNGAAVKTGARAATGNVLVFMDADSQHNPDDIQTLLSRLDQGYDMVVGARSGGSQANIGRWWANSLYNRLASWMVNQNVEDLTSGFRAVKADKFREFIHLLPNGFSYPTTITMSFFRAGYSVAYVPIHASKRRGASHIQPIRDGVRFFLIIFKIGALYSPMKLFVPISFSFFLTGLFYYIYTFVTSGRFTNMSALLFSVSVLIFLIGLVSEQITMLLYSGKEK